MYLRYASNDLLRNKGVNAALLVILILSAFLMATGAMVMERMFSSVDQLFDEAKPPHFLQMHKGEHDAAELTRFADQHPEIDAWLVEEMLGYDGAAIAWNRPATGEEGDLAESLIDNLFVTQNAEFDFLIDETGAIAQPGPGEVYVPVAYRQQFDLETGDELGVRTETGIHTLEVAGFVRDSQMASSLSSATRFVVAERDFAQLSEAGGGAPEIIAEYRLSDPSQVSDFQRAYESDEAMPKNGQAVTYSMIRMINAFSDGLVAVALVFVSLLLVAIALLNLRFVIRGTMEDEVREIGAMKAIGLPDKDIARLYLTKYSVMTALACLVGGVLAIGATHLLTRSVQANYAEASLGLMTVLVPVVALALVYLFVIVTCRGVLRGIRRIQVVDAMVHGEFGRRRVRRPRSVLASYRGGDVGRRLALIDLRAEAGQWVLIPVVFALAAILMTLPMNLLSTFESPRFVAYLGAPQSDIRADLQFSDDVDATRSGVLAGMEADDRLTDVRAYANVLYETPGEEDWETLRVEVGDYTAGTVEYVDGGRPADGQIALSVLNADKYDVAPGDELTVRDAGESEELVVSGVYQDVTSGGYTAKLQGEVTSGAAGYVIYANTVDADPAAVASEYDEEFPAAAVIPMADYVDQTLSYVTGAFKSAAILALVFGIGVAVLITGLFLKLRLTRDRRKLGVLSAIGFSAREIIGQIRMKVLLAVAAGTAQGVVLAATAGEWFVGSLISLAGLGIADLAFLPNLPLVYLAYPLLLVGAGLLAATGITARLRGADKSLWLRG